MQMCTGRSVHRSRLYPPLKQILMPGFQVLSPDRPGGFRLEKHLPAVLTEMPTNDYQVIRPRHRFRTNREDPGAIVQDSDLQQASNHLYELDVIHVHPLALSTSEEKKIGPAFSVKSGDLGERQNVQMKRN